MQKDKGNNKESDENNKKMTQGRNTIRTMKSKTLKSGDRPSTYSEPKKHPNDLLMLKDWFISQELLIGIK